MFGPNNFFDVHPVLFYNPLQNVTCDFDWGWFSMTVSIKSEARSSDRAMEAGRDM
jgi:hypothetical protein